MRKTILICCLFIVSILAVNAQANKAALENAKVLQKKLNLSESQTSKVAAIYTQSTVKYNKIKADDHGNTDKMLTDVGPLRVETIKKIKGVLTPAQAIKYDKLVKESKSASTGGGWSDGWSSPSSGN